jgi:hypothetical protein
MPSLSLVRPLDVGLSFNIGVKMSEIEILKKHILVLTNQRNYAFDMLAKLEAQLLLEREAASKSIQKENDEQRLN